jgi:hypothetical protein
MPLALYLVAALVLGVLVALQPLVNAVLARAIGSPYGAAGISIFVAALGAVLMLGVAGRGDLSRATLASVPWWVYLAGFVGTVFVAGSVVIAPVTGALVFSSAWWRASSSAPPSPTTSASSASTSARCPPPACSAWRWCSAACCWCSAADCGHRRRVGNVGRIACG